jgi:hypothetical protein
MPLMRRRPLMRAAMVGGAGYAIGQRREAGLQREQTQDQEISQLQQTQTAPPQPAAPQPAAPVTSSADRIEALTKLKALLDDGVITQEQFEAERDKLLQGM